VILTDPEGVYHFNPQGLLQVTRCGLDIGEGWNTVCAVSVVRVRERACDGCFRSALGVAA
jgi:hypothetical protein